MSYTIEDRFVAFLEDDGLTHYMIWLGDEWRVSCHPEDEPCYGCVTWAPRLPLCHVCASVEEMAI